MNELFCVQLNVTGPGVLLVRGVGKYTGNTPVLIFIDAAVIVYLHYVTPRRNTKCGIQKRYRMSYINFIKGKICDKSLGFFFLLNLGIRRTCNCKSFHLH